MGTLSSFVCESFNGLATGDILTTAEGLISAVSGVLGVRGGLAISTFASSKAETQFLRKDGLKVSLGRGEVLKARKASAESSEVDRPLLALIFEVRGEGNGYGDDLESSENLGELCDRTERETSESSEETSVEAEGWLIVGRLSIFPPRSRYSTTFVPFAVTAF